jgi:hypothetical protein
MIENVRIVLRVITFKILHVITSKILFYPFKSC